MATAIWGTLLFSSIVSYGAHILNQLFQGYINMHRPGMVLWGINKIAFPPFSENQLKFF